MPLCIMISLLLAATLLTCPATLFINRTDLPWNKADGKVYKRVVKRCPAVYDDAPCVKRFIKKYSSDGDGDITYWVICGANKKALYVKK